MLDKTTIEALVKLGAKAPEVINTDPAADPVVIIPGDQKLVTLAPFLPPKYIRQTVSLSEAGSFCDYVNRFKTDNTLIFADADREGVTFTAMLDYHNPAPDLKPARCAHLAVFTARETPEWIVWCASDRQTMNQVTFATFIEDNLALFHEPKGAELLDLVRSLHGHKNARFNSALRLDNGAWSVQYDEDITIKGSQSTSGGSLELPRVIKAGMAVFLGAAPYEVPARLKVRCEDRKLNLWYETINLPQIVRESVLLLVKQVAVQTKLIPLLGDPTGTTMEAK